jgi:hypothetical protein
MKWKLVALAAALLVPPGAGADTYVRSESHTDSYYRGGTVIPEDDSVRELWIGERRLAYRTEAQKIIVDLEQQSLVFVNLRENTYVETALPLDLSVVFSEEDAATLQLYRRTGKVRKTDESKKIGDRACTAYEFNDWIPYEGSRLNEREVTTWVTTDVPFDLKTFGLMFANLGRLGNLEDGYLEQLVAIEGFQLATDEVRYAEGLAITTTIRVVDISVAEPPPEAYAVPAGCEKKEQLSMQDL